jgi:hypothetical protein
LLLLLVVVAFLWMKILLRYESPPSPLDLFSPHHHRSHPSDHSSFIIHVTITMVVSCDFQNFKKINDQ